MPSALRAPRSISAEEYLLIERSAAVKSEWICGTIYNMAGASEVHITINFNLARLAGNQLRGSECRGFTNEMKVRTSPDGMFAYPDLTIVCGERRYHDAVKDVLLNPIVLFEILSPSTQSFDQGEKFQMYKELESLVEYVLVSQSEPRIERYIRQENGLWLPSLATGLSASMALSSVPVTLPLAEVYENVDFAAP